MRDDDRPTSYRPIPRPFTMHWGAGVVAEEASYVGEYHEPCIQLLQYTEGPAAGSYSVRFCFYSHDGRFQRSPLLVGEEEIEGLREAITRTPRLREILKRLVDG
ncbi:MAG TPA: hypothetical protein VFC51_10500 [Chloroflexota bacterium]|nr:hypothetical protein [Chloroflexota bacterium]